MDDPRAPAHGPLLLVEDDAELADMLVELFSGDGYRIDLARDGQRGLHLALRGRYQVIMLDRRLPAIDGVDLLIRLRRCAVAARVLMLSALADPTERIRGLDAGADDYLPKPFEVAELMARVRALTRRRFDGAELIPIGAGQLDLAQRGVRLPDGREVTLSGREFELIRLLATQPRMVHSRSQLRGRVFGADRTEAVVDTYVHYLRRKLGDGVVRTVHGLGYQIGAL
ncbi:MULTISPECIES: response regulator transcription factor [Micromonospora]|uniref:response regulator transcription factor n=1 Tax=Micromonospora TaxID=1873 RepID=UPI000A524791|nr:MULTISPECIES: response regulator transcription factor [Micromonospora]